MHGLLRARMGFTFSETWFGWRFWFKKLSEKEIIWFLTMRFQYSKTAECTNVCRARWITTAQFNWPSHLIVWQEDGWRAGSVEDLSAANSPHATSDVWTVLTQDL